MMITTMITTTVAAGTTKTAAVDDVAIDMKPAAATGAAKPIGFAATAGASGKYGPKAVRVTLDQGREE